MRALGFKVKILHISHGGLPDPRIEKTAYTMKKEGHQLIFLGGGTVKYQNLGVFERVHTLSLGNDLDVAINPFIKRRWLKAIQQIKPDVVHAHNLIVGNFLLDTEFPAVYDDHEYWSKQTFKYRERPLPRGLTSWPLIYMIPKWEDKILRKYPTITITENTATEHRKKSKWVGVTKNVPLLAQVEGLQGKVSRKGNVYVGNDFYLPNFFPHRNMVRLSNFIQFDIIWGETHRKMLEKLMNYKIGLTPWLPHPLHQYSDPNRNYEYMHAGLQVVTNKIIKKMFDSDSYVHAFKDYQSIRDLIDNIEDIEPSKIMRHARDQYIWEIQEDVIKKAYGHAML